VILTRWLKSSMVFFGHFKLEMERHAERSQGISYVRY
jgi:hypothetical protein